MKLLVVVGDMGGANEVIPVVKELENRGHLTTWIVDPGPQAKAGDKLNKAGIVFETRLPAMSDVDDCDLVLVGTSATASEAQIVVSCLAHLHNNRPVVWFEDLYGTGSHQSVRDISPDLMLTIDSIASEIARLVRPNLRVEAVGKPSFNALAPKLKAKTAIKQKLIDSCGIHPESFIITCVLGGKNVLAHIDALKTLPAEIDGRITTIVLRLHPKLQEEVRHTAMESLLQAGHLRVTLASEVTTDEAVIVADVAITNSGSTEQYVAALANVPPLITMFPDLDFCRAELSAKGYLDGKTPLVWAGGAAEIICGDRLALLVKEVSFPQCRAMMARYSRPFQTLINPDAVKLAADLIEATELLARKAKVLTELKGRLRRNYYGGPEGLCEVDPSAIAEAQVNSARISELRDLLHNINTKMGLDPADGLA